MCSDQSESLTGLPIDQIEQTVHPAGDQVAEQVQLGRHLRAADDRGKRPARMLERPRQRLELGLHQAPGEAGQQVRDRRSRSVRAVRA